MAVTNLALESSSAFMNRALVIKSQGENTTVRFFFRAAPPPKRSHFRNGHQLFEKNLQQSIAGLRPPLPIRYFIRSKQLFASY